MLRKFQIIANYGSTRPVASFVEFVAPFSGQVTQIDIWAKAQALGDDQTFNFAINGALQFSGAARPKVSGVYKHEQKTGLAFAVSFGDYLKLDLEKTTGAGLLSPVVFQVTFEDGQPITAYELAVAGGFVGDETAWLASLPGADGDDGAPGAPGADGVGIPAGGTTGQVLAKASGADYDTEFVDAATGGGGGGGTYFEDSFKGVILPDDLAANWTIYNDPNSRIEQFANGVINLSAAPPVSGTAVCGITRAKSYNATLDLRFGLVFSTVSSGNFPMLSFWLQNGSGKDGIALYPSGNFIGFSTGLSPTDGSGWGFSGSAPSPLLSAFGHLNTPIFFRLFGSGGNLYLSHSFDNIDFYNAYTGIGVLASFTAFGIGIRHGDSSNNQPGSLKLFHFEEVA